MGMMTINEKDTNFLCLLKERLLSNDCRSTAYPIFLVREKYKKTQVYGCGWFQEYIDDVGGECNTYDTLDELFNDLKENGYFDKEIEDDEDFSIESLVENEHFRTHSYDIGWRIIQTFYTEEGAQDFINRKKHDYNELEIYVDSLYDNQEMRELRDIILRMKIEI